MSQDFLPDSNQIPDYLTEEQKQVFVLYSVLKAAKDQSDLAAQNALYTKKLVDASYSKLAEVKKKIAEAVAQAVLEVGVPKVIEEPVAVEEEPVVEPTPVVTPVVPTKEPVVEAAPVVEAEPTEEVKAEAEPESTEEVEIVVEPALVALDIPEEVPTESLTETPEEE